MTVIQIHPWFRRLSRIQTRCSSVFTVFMVTRKGPEVRLQDLSGFVWACYGLPEALLLLVSAAAAF